MLALLGALTVVVLLAVIMLNLLSPLVALIAVPIIAALLGGFGLATSKFIITGISGIAPVAGMFVFAILYFGIMTDAGMLDPIIDRILRAVGTGPRASWSAPRCSRFSIHLDGSGAVCFLVTIPAMLPLYEKLGMDRRVLACAASLAAGVNFLPWTGPTLRASAALKIPVTEHLPADDRCSGGRPRLCFLYSLAARQTRGTAAWPGGAPWPCITNSTAR